MIGGDPAAAEVVGQAAEADILPAPANSSEDHYGEPPHTQPPRPVRGRPQPIRRVPKPKMTGLLDSPVRNLTAGVLYTITIIIIGTIAYMAAGWSLKDAFYMVVTTVYIVGYEEVRPINTPFLYATTLLLIVSGCTGIIFLTGALVQFFTLTQLSKVIGLKRMNAQIDQLTGARGGVRLRPHRQRLGALLERLERRLRRDRGRRSACQ
jgi:hypothetical protein